MLRAAERSFPSVQISVRFLIVSERSPGSAMTYFQFHLIFNLPLLLLLGWLVRRKLTRVHVRWMMVVIAIVVAFTFPWDNWAVGRKIWEFEDSRVTMRISHLPIEEILFFVVEAITVCLLTIYILPSPRSRK